MEAEFVYHILNHDLCIATEQNYYMWKRQVFLEFWNRIKYFVRQMKGKNWGCKASIFAFLCVINAILTALVIAFVCNNRAQGTAFWDWVSVIETMAIICHKWIEHLIFPSSVQEEPTEIATLTEAKENIKESLYRGKSELVVCQNTATLLCLHAQ